MVDQARSLRTAIDILLDGLGSPFDPGAVEVVENAASKPDIIPRLVPGQRAAIPEFSAVLSTIARDAIALLSDGGADRIRRCDGCAMWFLDRSRPGKRRWCSSSIKCGNRDRLHRYRHQE